MTKHGVTVETTSRSEVGGRGGVARWLLAALIGLGVGPRGNKEALAASHAGNTWVPAGSIRVRQGPSKVWFVRPRDHRGVIEEPMVLLGLYMPESPRVPNQQSTQPADAHATLELQIGERKFPPWDVYRYGTVYVVGLDTIRQNPKHADGQLEVKIDAVVPQGEVWLYAIASPDFLLAGEHEGPLKLLAEKAAAEDVRRYFGGLAEQFANRPEMARKAFRECTKSKDERVAGYARRSLRLLKAVQRSKVSEDNLAERYRWGLYLQQCGFFQMAMEEFVVCTNIDPLHGASWYRLGECAEHCGATTEQTATFMQRAGDAMQVADPTVWNVLVTIATEREVERRENGSVVKEKVTLTDDDIRRLKTQWLTVEKMVYGASRGMLQLNTSYHRLTPDGPTGLTTHEGWLAGPPDDLIEERGWFDSVISIRPHGPGEREQSGGGDSGPTGAGLSDLAGDADWQRMFRQWHHQFDWSVIAGEAGPGFPVTRDAAACGHGPVPSQGYGLRAALRYYVTGAMYRHAKIVPTVVPADERDEWESPPTRLRLWRLGEPIAVKVPWPESGRPASQLGLAWVSEPKTACLVDGESDFIDLKAALPGDGWRVARATCWVKSPGLQHVQLWLGHNDGAAVRVNGEPVHDGRYYATAKYADRNLPDMVASYATLEPGWNRVDVACEGWPAPRDKGWGFSVRLTTFDGRPLPGLRFSAREPREDLAPTYKPPETGFFYRWEACQEAYHELLPALSPGDLEQLTGLSGVRIRVMAEGPAGALAITHGGAAKGRYRAIDDSWTPAKNPDTVLNNVLDWLHEDVCALRFEKDGATRDLLVLKPEAFEAYLTLLREPALATSQYDGRTPSDRVVGYLAVPADDGATRTFLVVEAMLAEPGEGWPVDEEDLLDPTQP